METVFSLRHVVIARTLTKTEPSRLLLYKGRYRGEALLFELDSRRLLGGVRFDSGPQDSTEETWRAAAGALRSGLGMALPDIDWDY